MGDVTAYKKRPPERGYTEEELYNLFCKFCNQRNALRILADLMGYADTEYARETFERFKKRRGVNENQRC